MLSPPKQAHPVGIPEEEDDLFLDALVSPIRATPNSKGASARRRSTSLNPLLFVTNNKVRRREEGTAKRSLVSKKRVSIHDEFSGVKDAKKQLL